MTSHLSFLAKIRPERATQAIRPHARVVACLACVLLIGVVSPTSLVSAQDRFTVVASFPEADVLFEEAVSLFEMENYVEARTTFQRVVDDFELHRYTTAAALMGAKCAFRMGDFEIAEKELDDFLQIYPSSGYRSDARFTLRLAREAADRTVGDAMNIGVVLSLHKDEVTQSQALFNGVRLAVERANQTGLGRPVKMIFRDTDSSPQRAASAVRELADENVEFIIGTLFSDQAIAAAAAAEEERVVFVAPMATDERVSSGRQYAFQTNASIANRGRLMARFAILGLQLDSLGVITRTDETGISERLTDAFIQEASELGGKINLVSVMSDQNAWVTLSETLPADTLNYVEAIYVPVTDVQREQAIGAILSSLDRIGARTRILGNSTWHDLPMLTAASRYTTTYSNDYYLDDSTDESLAAIAEFDSLYSQLAGTEPDRLGYTGFDVATYLLNIVTRENRHDLDDALRFEPLFRGLATRIEFQGSNVNGALFFHRYRDNELMYIR